MKSFLHSPEQFHTTVHKWHKVCLSRHTVHCSNFPVQSSDPHVQRSNFQVQRSNSHKNYISSFWHWAWFGDNDLFPCATLDRPATRKKTKKQNKPTCKTPGPLGSGSENRLQGLVIQVIWTGGRRNQTGGRHNQTLSLVTAKTKICYRCSAQQTEQVTSSKEWVSLPLSLLDLKHRLGGEGGGGRFPVSGARSRDISPKGSTSRAAAPSFTHWLYPTCSPDPMRRTPHTFLTL